MDLAAEGELTSSVSVLTKGEAVGRRRVTTERQDMIRRNIVDREFDPNDFDYFNDYRDTAQWLRGRILVLQALLSQLDDGNKKYIATFLDPQEPTS